MRRCLLWLGFLLLTAIAVAYVCALDFGAVHLPAVVSEMFLPQPAGPIDALAIPAKRSPNLDVPVELLYLGALICLLIAAVMFRRCRLSEQCQQTSPRSLLRQ